MLSQDRKISQERRTSQERKISQERNISQERKISRDGIDLPETRAAIDEEKLPEDWAEPTDNENAGRKISNESQAPSSSKVSAERKVSSGRETSSENIADREVMPNDDTLDEDPGNAGDVANDNHDQEHDQVKSPSESGSNENELHEEENLSNGLLV